MRANATNSFFSVLPMEGKYLMFLDLISTDANSCICILCNRHISRLFIDNVGTVLVSEDPGKLKFKTACGWSMTLRRNVPPQAAVMQHD